VLFLGYGRARVGCSRPYGCRISQRSSLRVRQPAFWVAVAKLPALSCLAQRRWLPSQATLCAAPAVPDVAAVLTAAVTIVDATVVAADTLLPAADRDRGCCDEDDG